jgi:hypothetical protein
MKVNLLSSIIVSDTISGINLANVVTADVVNIAIKNVKNQKILVEVNHQCRVKQYYFNKNLHSF